MVKTFNDVGLSSVLQQTVVIDLDDIKVYDIHIYLTFRHEHQSVHDFEDAYRNTKRAGIFLVHPICPLYLAICIDT